MCDELDEYGLCPHDWEKIQGGKPEIRSENGLTVITHLYESGDGMEVRSKTTIEQMGTVLLWIGKVTFMVPIALLRSMHGEPCERKSRANGGKRYPRVKK